LKPPTDKQRAEKLLQIFKDELIPLLAPPPKLTIAEWADQHVWLGPDVTSQPGPFDTNFAPYQRGIMDAISERTTEKIVIMKAARVGITYAAILNPIGYYIHHDPCPMFLVYPTGDNAKRFSKKNLAPFINDCKPLRELIPEGKRTDDQNTLLLKLFPGGSLTLVGANSPNAMRVDTAKIAFIDEADAEVEMAEGDFIKLVENRTQTFAGRGRKIIMLSSPKNKGTSLIEPAYLNSTREKFHLPCPSCGHMQTLEWQRINLEDATHTCSQCNAGHTKREWSRNWEKTGTWIAEDPEHTTRGFHLSGLYSPFVAWELLIEEWRVANSEAAAGQLGKLQVFINTVLGETWEVRGERTDELAIMDRRIEYYVDAPEGVVGVPDGVCCITVAVDCQANRLAIAVTGWGDGKRSWGILYEEPYGDPRIPNSGVWNRLDDIILQPYAYSNGVRVPVVCVCVDMGFATEIVRAYTKSRRHWNVWAVRGVSGSGKALLYNRVQSKLAGTYEFNLAVDAGKEDVMARLNIKEPGPGYCYFPRSGKRDVTGEYESVRGYDERYFSGLTAEKKVLIQGKKGRPPRYEWQVITGRNNEPFDLAVYSLAALEISKFNLTRVAAQMPWAIDQLPIADMTPVVSMMPPPVASPAKKPLVRNVRKLNQSMASNTYTSV
jgi:phage terminase large subunit GpA-like protein